MTKRHATSDLAEPAQSHGIRSLKRAALLWHGTWRLMIALALCFAALSAHSQSYSIDWFTVDGGGGTSAAGIYSISGTVGQPDAGQMSGGSYTLKGGFWAILAPVQTPGAPLLRIVFTRTNAVVVAWPAPSVGFSLQQNTALGSANWTSVPYAVNVVGSENQVIVSPPVGNRFYRLKSP
jgi:hypothetical protein